MYIIGYSLAYASTFMKLLVESYNNDPYKDLEIKTTMNNLDLV